ncbi:MAG: hypothetical protein ACTSRP_04135 [Candidatus Helarchaeota archaeon]
MDLITGFLVSYWHILVAIIATLIVIWDFFRSSDNESNSAINLIVLNKAIEDSKIKFNDILQSNYNDTFSKSLQNDINMVKNLSKSLQDIIDFSYDDTNNINYLADFLSDYDRPKLSIKHWLSLIWTSFWIGLLTVIIVRLVFIPIYYLSDGIMIAWFIYYIILGLIMFFKKN